MNQPIDYEVLLDTDGIPPSLIEWFVTEYPDYARRSKNSIKGKNPIFWDIDKFPKLSMFTSHKFFPVYKMCLEKDKYISE